MRYRVIALLLSAGLLFGCAGCGSRSTEKMAGANGAMAPKAAGEQTASSHEVLEIPEETEAKTTEPAATTTAAAVTTRADSAGGTQPAATAGTLTDASGDFTYTGELQWIGDEAHGFLQVPASFMPFQDVDVPGLVQYCDGTPDTIVTLQHYDGVTAEQAAQNTYAGMEEEGTYDRMEGAEVPISDYQAKQIYAYYPDTAQYLVLWFIPDPVDAASSYYLAMEFTQETADIVACSSTFTPIRAE